MEIQSHKCSSKDHKEVDAFKFCQECKKYFCIKCEKFHQNLFGEHHTYSLDKDLKDIFTGFCKEESHNNELNYFCKDHNLLVCANCISKIKTRGNGKHCDCNVCDINDICEEKKKNLVNKIKNLEDLSKKFQSLVNDLKIILDQIEKNKDDVKEEIQKIFTKIRTELNNREDQLLLEVDEIFEKEFHNKCVDDVLKEKKFPDKIKEFIDKGKMAEQNWDKNENKSFLINNCINIENTITKINDMNASLEKSQKENKKLKFYSQSDEIISSIKNYGTFNNLKKINQQEININIDNFNPDNLNCVKLLVSNYYSYENNCFDSVCFFISKNKEHVLGYIDNNYSIIFFDINNNEEKKKFNNAHGNYIYTIKFYPYEQYDMILSSAYSNDIKIWNFNEGKNILTISNVLSYNNYNYYYLYSSCVVLEENDFKIFCVGWIYSGCEYIKMYNSNGNFNKNVGTNDDYRYFIDSSEVNEKKFLIVGGNKGVQVFNYPELTEYNNFNDNNDSNYHNYAKIVKVNDNYNLIDIGCFYHIKIWDFINKYLISKIIYDNTSNYLRGFVVVNNKYLITGCQDKNIKTFDIEKKCFIKNFNKHTSTVTGIKSIKDKNGNDFIVSYGQDNNIYLWSLK